MSSVDILSHHRPSLSKRHTAPQPSHLDLSSLPIHNSAYSRLPKILKKSSHASLPTVPSSPTSFITDFMPFTKSRPNRSQSQTSSFLPFQPSPTTSYIHVDPLSPTSSGHDIGDGPSNRLRKKSIAGSSPPNTPRGSSFRRDVKMSMTRSLMPSIQGIMEAADDRQLQGRSVASTTKESKRSRRDTLNLPMMPPPTQLPPLPTHTPLSHNDGTHRTVSTRANPEYNISDSDSIGAKGATKKDNKTNNININHPLHTTSASRLDSDDSDWDFVSITSKNTGNNSTPKHSLFSSSSRCVSRQSQNNNNHTTHASDNANQDCHRDYIQAEWIDPELSSLSSELDLKAVEVLAHLSDHLSQHSWDQELDNYRSGAPISPTTRAGTGSASVRSWRESRKASRHIPLLRPLSEQPTYRTPPLPPPDQPVPPTPTPTPRRKHFSQGPHQSVSPRSIDPEDPGDSTSTMRPGLFLTRPSMDGPERKSTDGGARAFFRIKEKDKEKGEHKKLSIGSVLRKEKVFTHGPFVSSSIDVSNDHDKEANELSVSSPLSRIPIHQRPLPPLPTALPARHNSTSSNSILHNKFRARLLRPKNLMTQPQSSPISPTGQYISTPPKMSAREEPSPGLRRREDASGARKNGMTALSFLANEQPEPKASSSRAGSSRHQDRNSLSAVNSPNPPDSPVVKHILPPSEVFKIGLRRRRSDASEMSQDGQSLDSSLMDTRSNVARYGSGITLDEVPRRTMTPTGERPIRLGLRTTSMNSLIKDKIPTPTALSPPPRPRPPPAPRPTFNEYAIQAPPPVSAVTLASIDRPLTLGENWSRSNTPSPTKKTFSDIATRGDTDSERNEEEDEIMKTPQLDHSPVPDQDFGTQALSPVKTPTDTDQVTPIALAFTQRDTSMQSEQDGRKASEDSTVISTPLSNTSDGGSGWSMDVETGTAQRDIQKGREKVTPLLHLHQRYIRDKRAEDAKLGTHVGSVEKEGALPLPIWTRLVEHDKGQIGEDGEEEEVDEVEQRRAALREWLMAKPRRSTEPRVASNDRAVQVDDYDLGRLGLGLGLGLGT